uniref:G-protein coupled receptors family 1 profile domain-containing protein n=1 Tax=Timema genevievae TaxID=629358 RepID=A0A7R9JSC6_TIMGE|nr:unnamed protein product [Timema genevievae]
MSEIEPGTIGSVDRAATECRTDQGCNYLGQQESKNRLLYRVCLISLASSDLIVAVMSGINNIPKFLLPSHNFFILGEFMCSFMPLLQNTSLLANSMTLSCIAVDRYQMVVQAVRGRWDPGKYVCFGVVAGIWVISAGVASPMYGLYLWITAMIIQDDGVNITILEQYSVFHMCLLDDKTFKYTYFLIVFSFIFLPLLCTFLVLYILVVRYLLLWRRPELLSLGAKHPRRRRDGPQENIVHVPETGT